MFLSCIERLSCFLVRKITLEPLMSGPQGAFWPRWFWEMLTYKGIMKDCSYWRLYKSAEISTQRTFSTSILAILIISLLFTLFRNVRKNGNNSVSVVNSLKTVRVEETLKIWWRKFSFMLKIRELQQNRLIITSFSTMSEYSWTMSKN